MYIYAKLMIFAEKHLPALKCLLASYQLDPDHPKCHEQGGRLKLALDSLSEPLPSQVKEVIDSSYLSKLSSKSLEECNEEYLESHKDSAPHVQSVVRFRNFLKPGAEDTKSKGARDLQTTVSLESTTLQQAIDSLGLFDELEMPKDALQTYIQAASKRWPEASAFQTSS